MKSEGALGWSEGEVGVYDVCRVGVCGCLSEDDTDTNTLLS